MDMDALTLMQPFATLMAIGAKTNETRSWRTHKRGRTAIHASANISPEFKALCSQEPFKSTLKAAGYNSWRDLPTGAVLGTLSITGCKMIIGRDKQHKIAKLEDGTYVSGNEFFFGDYTPQRYAIRTQDVVRFNDPIPAKGKLGFWKWNDPRTTQLGGRPSDR